MKTVFRSCDLFSLPISKWLGPCISISAVATELANSASWDALYLVHLISDDAIQKDCMELAFHVSILTQLL